MLDAFSGRHVRGIDDDCAVQAGIDHLLVVVRVVDERPTSARDEGVAEAATRLYERL